MATGRFLLSRFYFHAFRKKGSGTFLFYKMFFMPRVCRTVNENEQRQGITMMVVPCLCYYKFSRLKVITEASERSRFLWTISPSSLRCGRRSWRGGHRKCYATQRTPHRGWLPADTVQNGQRPEMWPDRSSAYRPRWKLHGTWWSPASAACPRQSR